MAAAAAAWRQTAANTGSRFQPAVAHARSRLSVVNRLIKLAQKSAYFGHLQNFVNSNSQYSTVVLTVVRVMISMYRKQGNWGYRSSVTPEPIELSTL